jgi:ABC-type bacteriocin/lantibiotic exporter with double-glycine peptidase domain
MILAAYGDERSEEELSRLLKSRDVGTRARNVTFLERIGYHVKYGPTDLETVKQELAAGRYVIAFVQADFLSWANFGGLHAIVVVEQVFDNEIMIHDPAQPTGPQRVERDEFLLAWEEFDCTAAVVWRE